MRTTLLLIGAWLLSPGLIFAAPTSPDIAKADRVPLLAVTVPANGAYGQKEYSAMWLAWNKRTLIPPYQQGSFTDPKWDSTVLQLLTNYAEFVTGIFNGTDMFWHYGTSVHAMNLGCQDPLVRYIYAWSLQDQRRQDAAQPHFEAVFKELADEHYPSIRHAFSAMRLMGNMSEIKTATPENRAPLLEAYISSNVKSLQRGEFVGLEERVYFDLITGQLALWLDHSLFPANRLWPVLLGKLRAQKLGSPWLLSMIEADYHVRLAWQARGKGYAKDVTPEGWRIFQAEYPKAMALYRQAYKLKPDYPEAASEIIQGITAGFGAPGESRALWFTRAVRAQFDFEDAYSAYLYSLLPRWDGTPEQTMAFARACLATKRFDTTIPLIYWEAIRLLMVDIQDTDGRIFTDPGIYADCKTYFDALLQTPMDYHQLTLTRTTYFSIAFIAKDYDKARHLLAITGPDAEKALKAVPFMKKSMSELRAVLDAPASSPK